MWEATPLLCTKRERFSIIAPVESRVRGVNKSIAGLPLKAGPNE
jgi:hypothetical protein